MRSFIRLTTVVAATGLGIGCQSIPLETAPQGTAPVRFQIAAAPSRDLVGSRITVAAAATQERLPDVDFNPATGEYMVSYEEFTGSALQVLGQRISGTGSLIGGRIEVSPAVNAHQVSSVTANPSNSQYLFSWNFQQGSTQDILGQLVSGTGTLVGSSISIAVDASTQNQQDAACNPTDSEYLAVWADNRNSNNDIFARRFLANGTAAGADFPITTVTNGDQNPRVAYSPTSGTYLVVWWESPTGDAYAQLVSASGALIGGRFPLSSGGGSELVPDVAYNTQDNQFLVVWQDTRSGTTVDVFGQRVNPADGSLLGGNVAVASGSFDQAQPRVAYDASTNRYLVAFLDTAFSSGTNFDLFAQRLRADGTPVGNRFAIATTSAAEQNSAVVCNPSASEFLVTWWDEGLNDIFAQRVTASVADPLAPTWPKGSKLNFTNVTATSMTVGWPAATDDTAIDSYLVFQDGVMVATTSSGVFSYTATGLSPQTSFTFKIEAKDDGGNISSTGPSAKKRTSR